MILTASGSWNPLVFLLCCAAASLIVLLVRALGERGCRKEKEKSATFFSGDLSPEENRATNPYWGFFEALKGYYRRMERIHNGVINDYVYWFVLALVAVMCVVMFL
jgi:hypothetical protein